MKPKPGQGTGKQNVVIKAPEDDKTQEPQKGSTKGSRPTSQPSKTDATKASRDTPRVSPESIEVEITKEPLETPGWFSQWLPRSSPRSSTLDDQVEKEEKEIPSKKKLFWTNFKLYHRQFSEIVELHGFRYLTEKRSTSEMLFWLIVVLGSLSACIYWINAIFEIYLETPVIVSFSTKDTPIFEVPFPAVTICAQPKTEIKNFSFIKAFKEFGKNKSFSDGNLMHYYQYYHLVCELTGTHHDHEFDHKFTDTFSDDYLEIVEEVSPSVDDLLYECTFMGTTKDCSRFFKPVFTNLGICYSFNMLHWREIYRDNVVHQPGYYKHDGKKNDWSSQVGYISTHKVETYPRRGFASGAQNSLLVKLRQNKSLVDPVCTSGILGFKMSIHDPVQPPDFSQYYIPVAYDTSVIAAIEPSLMTATEEVKKFTPKQRKCFLESEKSLKFFKTYSNRKCIIECLGSFINSKCRCIPFYMPRDKSTKICGVAQHHCAAHAKNLFVIQRLKTQVHENEGFCNCKPLCTELKYNLEVAVSDWDWPKYYTHVLLGNDSEEYKMSMVRIFFKSDYFLKLQRTEFYGSADVLAHIGGLINLFLGASILTVIEFIYFFTLRIMCNKLIYGPWAGAVAVEYKFDIDDY